MSEVKHYFWVQDGMSGGVKSLETYVKSPDFDRVTAERDSLQQRLTAVDERADVLRSGSALGDVHLERLRQIDVENRSPVDDDDYSLGQLAYAAAGYAQGSVPAQQVQGCLRPSYWPWHPRWWKPGSPRRMLVKAAALILAEIERIDRVALKPADTAKCERCGCSTVETCDERGCGYLGAGNGAPE